MFLRPLTRAPVLQDDAGDPHLGAPKLLSKDASWGPLPDGDATGDAEEGGIVTGAELVGANVTGAEDVGAEDTGAFETGAKDTGALEVGALVWATGCEEGD
jgi:hypothetical protein